ncbi:MAG TPA: hypothetical protein VFK47_15060 [Ktedonobacteraceae bacterium]|nr:hypothetical protein [Ktedonobacteraceae bacterium]
MTGRKEHIGRQQFLAHYEPYRPAESKQQPSEKIEIPPSIPLSSLEPMKPTSQQFDYDVDALLERVATAIAKWGTPIRSYVLTQYYNNQIKNKEEALKFIQYGVSKGVLESWEEVVHGRASSILVCVPGQPHVVTPSSSKPRTPDRDTQALSNRAVELISKQYDGLSEEQRDEIAQLASDGVSNVEIQKAYGVLSAVVGRIKRERGITSPPPPSKVKKKKPAPLIIEEDTADLDNIAQLLRDAPPAKVTPTVVVLPPKPAPPAPPVFIQKEVPVPQSVENTNGKTTFKVTVLKYIPTEVEVIVTADNMGDAYLQARQIEQVLDVLTVSKVR